MKKMFLCESGEMFSIEDVRSIKEAEKYLSKRGVEIRPNRIFESKDDMGRAMDEDMKKNNISCLAMLSWVTQDIVGSLFGNFEWGDKIETCLYDRNRGARVKAYALKRKSRLEFYNVNGYYRADDGSVWCMKQWDVEVGDHLQIVRISNADCIRLSEEIGK